MKVKVHAYKGALIIESIKPEEDHPDWVPCGDGKIGCLIMNTKENLGVSEEAFALLASIKRSRDDIGEIDWFGSHKSGYCFGWLGGPYKIARPEDCTGSSSYAADKSQCIIIPNEPPEAAARVIDDEGLWKPAMPWPVTSRSKLPM